MDINNVNNCTTNTINTTYSSYCPYRLPCGYCEKLYRDCPKQWYGNFDITTLNNIDLGEIKQ